MDLTFDIFKVDYNNILPRQGRVLISDPFLNDAYFKRSIVFLTEHSPKGTVGFVLNNPVDVSLDQIVSDFPEIESPVSVGGPVGTNTIHFIHSVGELIPNSMKVTGQIWWGGDFEVVKQLISEGTLQNNHIRFFVGYSGWEPEQLEREISECSWLVREFDSDLIMNSYERKSWKDVLNMLGDKFKLWTNFPENTTLN